MPRVASTTRRWNSAETAAPTNPKIAQIVDQISKLTLLETADLVSSLKVCGDALAGVAEACWLNQS